MSKRILIINNGLAGGGIERASVSLANFFVSQGYELIVLALYKSDKFYKLHNQILFIEPDFQRDSVNRYFYLVKMIIYIRKQVKAHKPDTILSFGEWTNSYVVLSLLGMKLPLFLSDRMSPLAKLPFISEFLRKKLYRRATGIIAQSNFAKSILQQKTNSKNIHVIYNPVNAIEKIQCIPKNRIVTVGRLEEVKGHKYLIHAFAQLNHKDWELSIVGDGTLKNELVALAESLNIKNRVIFHGKLSDFRLQLSEAEIFVLPSLKEGFPNSLIEAMSVPLACISSDTFNGHNEIIEHTVNGLLVKPGDINELSISLNQLIENVNFRARLKENAYKIRFDLNFDKIAMKYLEIIL